MKARNLMERNQTLRLFILNRMYEEAESSKWKRFAPSDFLPLNDYDLVEVGRALRYLCDEGLIRGQQGYLGGADEYIFVTLEHGGIVEVEKAMMNPDKPTEHFIATVIQNFYGSVGASQVGSNTAEIKQVP